MFLKLKRVKKFRFPGCERLSDEFLCFIVYDALVPFHDRAPCILLQKGFEIAQLFFVDFLEKLIDLGIITEKMPHYLELIVKSYCLNFRLAITS